MQNGEKKDARYYAELVKDAVEELGPKNIATIVTDNASVMLFGKSYNHYTLGFFFCGCLAHKGNTFVKKICALAKVDILVKEAKKIIHIFSEVHANCAILTLCR